MPPPVLLWLPDHLNTSERNRLLSLAERFSITPVFRQPEEMYFLHFDGEKIVLRIHGQRASVYADFDSGSLSHRTARPNGELIARALNLRENKIIWDATAGLGKDAFVLAALGAHVHMFEHHPIPALLLADALERTGLSEKTLNIIARMRLTFGSIEDIHLTQTEVPDAVYLDPMFPERQKSALVKKEMRFFQEALGEEENNGNLLDTARKYAQRRIVVKRPRLGTYLSHTTPAYQYFGKSTRFDVYLPLPTGTLSKELSLFV